MSQNSKIECKCKRAGDIDHVNISQLLGSNAKCMICGFAYPKDPKGGDITEWPDALQVRETPRR